MAKHYYCAACGRELNVFRKAIPKKAIVLDLVEPHECNPEEVVDDYEFLPKEKVKIEDGIHDEKIITITEKKKLDFSFVSKLNKAPDTEPLIAEDKRSKDHTRKELTTSAPAGILQRMGDASSPPENARDLEDPENGD